MFVCCFYFGYLFVLCFFPSHAWLLSYKSLKNKKAVNAWSRKFSVCYIFRQFTVFTTERYLLEFKTTITFFCLKSHSYIWFRCLFTIFENPLFCVCLFYLFFIIFCLNDVSMNIEYKHTHTPLRNCAIIYHVICMCSVGFWQHGFERITREEKIWTLCL